MRKFLLLLTSKTTGQKDNIFFVVSRGLLNGISATTFSPNTGMTRGMFVTALGRLAGIDPADYQAGKFTDVKADAYYVPYVNWAASKGIVSGTTDTTFAPDSQITREQMAVILKNYAAKLGYTIPKTLEAVTFADNTKISSQVKEAVKSMQQAGILAGKTNNRFDPKGNCYPRRSCHRPASVRGNHHRLADCKWLAAE